MQVYDSRLVGLKVLVTGAGSPAGHELLDHLSRSLPNLVLHAADVSPLASGLYSVLSDRRHVLPCRDHEDVAATVSDICRLHRIDLLIPTRDAELEPLAAARDLLLESRVRVAVSSRDRLITCLDEYALTMALDGIVPIPKTTLWRGQLLDISHRFPLVARPRRGSGSHRSLVLHGPSELECIPADGSHVLCSDLPGPEYVVSVFRSRAKKVLAAVPQERLRSEAGVVMAARTMRDPQLEQLATDAVDHLDLYGATSVGVRCDGDGMPRVMSVKPRFTDSTALTVAAGVDMPTMAVLDAMGVPLQTSPLSFEEVAIVRQWTGRVLEPRGARGGMGVAAGGGGGLARAS